MNPAHDIAQKILAKYGLKEGQAPSTTHTMQETRGNVQSSPPKPVAMENASPVILLTNMVGPGEVDDMLQEETADECSKYGKVQRCLIFEVRMNTSR